MRFSNPAEQNITTEIFRVANVIERWPRAVYEIEDLNGTAIEGQFYREEQTPVHITDRTAYKIDKILDNKGQTRHSRIYLPLARLESEH